MHLKYDAADDAENDAVVEGNANHLGSPHPCRLNSVIMKLMIAFVNIRYTNPKPFGEDFKIPSSFILNVLVREIDLGENPSLIPVVAAVTDPWPGP